MYNKQPKCSVLRFVTNFAFIAFAILLLKGFFDFTEIDVVFCLIVTTVEVIRSQRRVVDLKARKKDLNSVIMSVAGSIPAQVSDGKRGAIR